MSAPRPGSLRRRAGRRAVAIVSAAALAGLFTLVSPAPPASASVVSLVPGTLNYQAAPGEDNVVTVSRVGGNFVILDEGVTNVPGTIAITTGAGCVVSTTTNPSDTATCPATGVTSLQVLAGDGNDSVRIDGTVFGPTSATLVGGSGNDQLENDSTVPTTFVGGPGTDTITGRAGGNDGVDYGTAASGVVVSLRAGSASNDGDGESDVLTNIRNVFGSPNADTIEGDAGNNFLTGGGGSDALSFAGAASGVTADLGSGTAFGDGSDTLAGFSSVIGSSHDDVLTGDGGDNYLAGGPGNDILTGGGGVDTLDGQDGNDSLSGENGNDTLYGGDGNDTLVPGQGLDQAYGGPGNDTLVAGDGDLLSGDSGDDTVVEGPGDGVNTTLVSGGAGTDAVDYSGSPVPVTVDMSLGTTQNTGEGRLEQFADLIENATGSPFGDTITGNAGDNLLKGAGGDDVLIGGSGDDSLDGGSGTDTASFAGGNPVDANLATGVATGQGTDSLTAIENLLGSDYADLLTGNALNNVLTGGLGDDTLNGGPGQDLLVGGGGSDTADYSDAPNGVIVDLAAGTATGYGTDVLSGISNVIGSSHDDVLAGDGNANRILAGFGNDTVLIKDGVADTADCGPGTDSATADAGDTVTNCEQVGNGLIAQQITFPALPSRSVVDLPFTIQGVTGGASGNPVTFTASGACTISGATVTLIHTGTCTVTAHQAGNATYSPAPDVSRSFAVVGKPQVTIGDVNTLEGNSGTRPLTFRIVLNRAVTVPVTLHWATANGTAKAPGDFFAASGTVTFAPGQTVRTISVAIKGDQLKEPNEIFYVLLSNPQQAVIADANASGGIRNDD